MIHKFHYRLGGAERIYFETARLLEEAGHEVAFFSMQHPKNEITPWSKYFVSEVEYGDENKGFLEKLRIASRILWNREATQKLDALIKEFKPDVAHCFNVFHQLSPAVFWVLKKYHIPTVLTLCDFKVISPNYFLYHFDEKRIWESTSGWRCIKEKCVKNSYAKSAICALEKWIHDFLGSYLKVDLFLAPSDFLTRKYHELGFVPSIKRVHHPASMSRSCMNHMPFHERSNEYLYFGRFSVEKGVNVLIEAFSKISEESKLLLVGYGPEEQSLRTLVKEKKLENRVEFLGGVYGDALQQLISRVRVVILPVVWYENQPFVMMDTLASGTLLIASRIGGIPDILKDHENGLLFEAGNVLDLARVIQSVPECDYQQLVTTAYDVASTYTDERYLTELLGYYGEVQS